MAWLSVRGHEPLSVNTQAASQKFIWIVSAGAAGVNVRQARAARPFKNRPAHGDLISTTESAPKESGPITLENPILAID
jgi:hypothetical protein